MPQALVGIAIFFLGGLVSPLAGARWKGPLFALGAGLAQVFILPAVLRVLWEGHPLTLAVDFSFPIGLAVFRMDPLAAFFALIISIGGLLTALYSLGYMKMYRESGYSLSTYYLGMGLLIAAMLLVVLVQNALLFMIVWEIMSLASFFLVSFEHHKEEVRRAGVYYLVSMQVGAAFLMTAFAWASTRTGSLDFASFSQVLGGQDLSAAGLFLLFLTGFGVKAGLLPLHTWLPLAHPAAPTGVSAIMSGVMIKTGIYGILRILLIGGVPHLLLAYLVFGLSLLTGIFGVINAIAQHDLKKLLAYHSIENIGIIGSGLGLGMLGLAYGQNTIALFGFLGGLLHVLNHFIFKSLLFYGAGVIYLKTHTREIDRLGGLIHELPVTAVLFLIGSLAISGLPVFNGFISEFAIFAGLARSLTLGSVSLNVAILCGLAGLAFIGALALLCFTKVFSICFLGTPRVPHPEPLTEAAFSMVAPMLVLTVMILGIGLFAPLVLPLLTHVLGQFVPGLGGAEFAGLLALYRRLSLAIAALGGFSLFFLGLRWFLLRGKAVTRFKTWDCGYQEGSSRFSYTASSFAAPFMQLVALVVPQELHVQPPQGLFPREAHYASHSHDLLEIMLIRPVNAFLGRFLGLFTWIQSGRTQQYILYGLIFLVLLIIWIMGFS